MPAPNKVECSGENSSRHQNTGNSLHPHYDRQKTKAKKKALSEQRFEWVVRLIEEKGMQKAAVAIANHNARTILSILKSGEAYHPDGSQGDRLAVA